MNRETKRLMQRQGQVRSDGSVATRQPPSKPAPRPSTERRSPVKFVSDVRAELRRVIWPTRDEVVNFSIVVLITLVLITALIFALDYGFAQAVTYLFKP